MNRVFAIFAVAMTALALTSTAFASSLTSGHGSVSGVSAKLAATVTKKSTVKKPVTVVKAGTLPFTGVDLGGVALGGLGLLAVGFVLVRTSRRTA